MLICPVAAQRCQLQLQLHASKGGRAPAPAALPDLGHQTELLPGLESAVKLLASVAYASFTFRPRGWSLVGECLDVRTSSIPNAGRGVFATAHIKQGTVLGAYPGIPRTDEEMTAKSMVVPMSRSYVFNVRPGVILDPTDHTGLPSPRPVPTRLFWPFDVDCTLSYVNEPSIDLGVGVNVVVEDDRSDPRVGLVFLADRDIAAGEELFIDYGVSYDRSSYVKK